MMTDSEPKCIKLKLQSGMIIMLSLSDIVAFIKQK